MAEFYLSVPHEGACECKVGSYARVWSLLVIFTYLTKSKLYLSIVLKAAAANISIPLGTLRLRLYFLNSLEQLGPWLPHCYTAANRLFRAYYYYDSLERGSFIFRKFPMSYGMENLETLAYTSLILLGRQLFKTES